MTESDFSAAPQHPGILAQLLAFLRSPQVLSPEGLRSTHSWKTLGVLYLIHVSILLLVILPITAGLQALLGLSPPDAFGKLPEGWLIPITVIIAPILEELFFRSWQTGRPRAFWLLACTMAGGAVLAGISHGLNPLWAAGLLLALVIAAATGWFALRKRAAPAFYLKAYPAIFWIVAAGFAAVHILNYGDASPLTTLLVLPQLWAGIMLGFTRQKLGLGASMLQHASANAAVMALAFFPGL